MTMTAAAIQKIKVHRMVERWITIGIYYRIATEITLIGIAART